MLKKIKPSRWNFFSYSTDDKEKSKIEQFFDELTEDSLKIKL